MLPLYSHTWWWWFSCVPWAAVVSAGGSPGDRRYGRFIVRFQVKVITARAVWGHGAEEGWLPSCPPGLSAWGEGWSSSVVPSAPQGKAAQQEPVTVSFIYSHRITTACCLPTSSAFSPICKTPHLGLIRSSSKYLIYGASPMTFPTITSKQILPMATTQQWHFPLPSSIFCWLKCYGLFKP